MPEAVCPCSLGFASIALLSTGAGLVVLNLPAVKYLGRGGAVCSTFWKNIEKYLFQGSLCYHGVDERIRLQE